MKKPIGRFHVITDESTQREFSHIQIAALAIAGGADTIQYRDKDASTRELIETALAIRELCDEARVTFIVNDRTDVALAVGADGVHLGQQDLPIRAARRILGADKIIGGSASSVAQARRARSEGADYIGFGNIYTTRSKKKVHRPRGVDALREVCRAMPVPVVAIGGIRMKNLLPVLEAGAWGIAVIEAVVGAADPKGAARELSGMIRSHERFEPR